MSLAERAAAEEVDEEEEEEEEEEEKKKKDGNRRPQLQSSSPLPAADEEGAPTPFPSSAAGWKARYIACEVDLCRSFLTLPELLGHRWRFRFHFTFDQPRATYPVFTKTRVRTGLGDDAYDWKWVERDRIGGEEAELLAYNIRHFVHRDDLPSPQRRPRGPYWLRSCGARITAAFSHSAQQTTQPPSAEPASSAPASAPALHSFSGLLSPAVPAFRYLPGHPFFTLSTLQLQDCRVVRGMQVSHFPPLTITRMPDGGWQLMNQYVVISSRPEDEEEEREDTDDDDEEEEGEEDGEAQEEEEAEEAEEGERGEEDEQQHGDDGEGMEARARARRGAVRGLDDDGDGGAMEDDTASD